VVKTGRNLYKPVLFTFLPSTGSIMASISAFHFGLGQRGEPIVRVRKTRFSLENPAG